MTKSYDTYHFTKDKRNATQTGNAFYRKILIIINKTQTRDGPVGRTVYWRLKHESKGRYQIEKKGEIENERRANSSKRKTMKINPPTFGFPQINKEKNRERDTDVKLGCLSHSPRA